MARGDTSSAGTSQSRPWTPVPYEERLRGHVDLSLREGEEFFAGRSEPKLTLRRLTRRLEALRIPYAVIGAMALNAHGYRRFTQDVDIVVTREALREIHEKLEGLGFVAPFTGSKNLRDTANGVRIDLLVAGGFPGDGKPKPVAFPDPAQETAVIDGVHYVTLPKLIELKLASGLSNPLRLRDLGDVQELMKVVRPPRELGRELDPSVRSTYEEYWDLIAADPHKDEF